MTMATDVQHLIPKVCIERATPTGSRFVPLVPVDQIPHQIQEIPLHITGRQMTDEAWYLIGEPISGLPMALSVHLSTIPTPKYRAPDHDVTKGEPAHATQKISKLQKQATRFPSWSPGKVEHPQMRSEHHHGQGEDDEGPKSAPLNYHLEAATVDQAFPAAADPKSFHNHHIPYAAGTETPTTHAGESVLKTRETNDHALYQEANYINTSQSGGRNIGTRTEGIGTNSDPSVYVRQSHPSAMDDSRAKKDIFNDSNSRAIGHRNHTVQRSRPDKVYCTHWINTGSCLYGPRCVYLHVMPEIDLLREVTGLRSYPQWWKDEKAIKPRGATWLETKIRADKDTHGDQLDSARMFAPPQMPDPSIWRSSREQSRVVKKTVEKENQKSHFDIGSPSMSIQNDSSAVRAAVIITSDYGPVTTSNAPPTPSAAPTKEVTVNTTTIRRLSQLSLSSSSTVSTPLSKKQSKVKLPLKKDNRSVALSSVKQPKKTGLAASIYAPKDNCKDILDDTHSVQDRHGRPNRCSRRSRLQSKVSDVANLLINLEQPTIEQYICSPDESLLSD